MRYGQRGGCTPVEQKRRERGKLLHRHGWSVQVPARRALERDEEAIAAWEAEVWPVVKAPRRTWAPTSVSRTKPGKG
ncbi:winged helix-turn-helix domain-containing protein [Nonomuraea angiospora]|uniref:winged helix-turn-helix domain-containing protein n=1 Tax=Nonomuraea angiospora TaxID=46172 RepID=UPI0038D489E8